MVKLGNHNTAKAKINTPTNAKIVAPSCEINPLPSGNLKTKAASDKKTANTPVINVQRTISMA